jgi:hypothetical protein
MTYTLPVSHHAPKLLRKLQSPATRATLMKLGCNQNTAHRVVCGPSRYGGLGFPYFFVEQGIGQVQLLVRHLQAASPQGVLMRISLFWWQLVVGVSFSLLGQTSTEIPHPAMHWLLSLREFLKTIDTSIHTAGLSLSDPLRESDVCIMDVIHPLPSLTKAQLRAFNRYRIFFGVHYVSEITTADGRQLCHDAWDGSRHRLSPLLWPYQPEPGPKSFQTWRCLLAMAFLKCHHHRVSLRTCDLTLRRPLGRWLHNSDAFRYHWPSLYSAATATLFVLLDDNRSFSLHPPRRNRQRPKNPVRAFSIDSVATVTVLPPNAIPVDCRQEPNKYVIPETLPTLMPDHHTEPPATTWDSYLWTLPLWDQ